MARYLGKLTHGRIGTPRKGGFTPKAGQLQAVNMTANANPGMDGTPASSAATVSPMAHAQAPHYQPTV